jgi:hypothetical protein
MYLLTVLFCLVEVRAVEPILCKNVNKKDASNSNANSLIYNHTPEGTGHFPLLLVLLCAQLVK